MWFCSWRYTLTGLPGSDILDTYWLHSLLWDCGLRVARLGSIYGALWPMSWLCGSVGWQRGQGLVQVRVVFQNNSPIFTLPIGSMGQLTHRLLQPYSCKCHRTPATPTLIGRPFISAALTRLSAPVSFPMALKVLNTIPPNNSLIL